MSTRLTAWSLYRCPLTAYRVAMELYDSEREAILEAPMWGEKDKIRPEDLEVT